ncbi:hypothetical protein BJ878DRAFT_478899 [Calycina marina]|uniref:DUF6594 domain-containing protein n=1 Tax=Calycina marina TaxID=1763456 RepID=A0A9P8CGG4_9HELO|nr:hypothetical protein BJ878DRAFT_478899 [Calycina marina]
MGYIKLSNFMASKDYAMFRQFRPSAIRDLLYLQAELIHLESEYQGAAKDNRESNDDERRMYAVEWWHLSQSEEHELGGEQLRLALKIRSKLREYSMNRPKNFQAKALRQWIESPHLGGGCGFIGRDLGGFVQDIVYHGSYLDDMIMPICNLGEDDLLTRFTPGPFLKASHLIWRKHKIRLGLVCLFTVLFPIVLALATKARRVEIFAATAALSDRDMKLHGQPTGSLSAPMPAVMFAGPYTIAVLYLSSAAEPHPSFAVSLIRKISRKPKPRKLQGGNIRNDTTYAFLVRIVPGEDYKEPDTIDALALYNESCTYNFISGKFAKDYLHIEGTEVDNDCSLVWACDGLGRYAQHTIFWIAPHATDFDILFGIQEDSNSRKCERDQFQNGITRGILSTQDPRVDPMLEVFRGGIKDEFLLPVGHGNSSPGKYPMPTLAEIKVQLAAQLGSTLQRKFEHKRNHSLNVYDPQFTTQEPETVTAAKICLLVGDGLATSDERSCKGSKRTAEDISEITSESASYCPRSQKSRNVRPRSTHKPKSCLLYENLTSDVFEPPTTIHTDVETRPTIDAISDGSERRREAGRIICNATELERQHIPSRLRTEEDVMVFGMGDRSTGHERNQSHDSSSISLSGPELDPRSGDSSPSQTSIQTRRISLRISHSVQEYADSAAYVDRIDEKFHSFWSWDGKFANWYHTDDTTKHVIWYKAPR